MDYYLQEISNFFGRPTYLVTFRRGNKTWTHTSADRDITFEGIVYKATPMKVGGVNRTGDPQADEFTIEVPAMLEMVQLHISVPPTERVDVTMARYHRNGDNVVVRFNGQIDRIKRMSPAKAEVKCKTLLATMARSGARLTWQRGCTHALYDVGCKVPMSEHAVPGVVDYADGVTVGADAFAALADGRFVGGFIQWDTQPAVPARRAITSHVGTQVTLLGGVYGLEAGMPFTAYPGCPRNAEACDGFYGNMPNYGGVRHLPSRSPFDGNPVF